MGHINHFDESGEYEYDTAGILIDHNPNHIGCADDDMADDHHYDLDDLDDLDDLRVDFVDALIDYYAGAPNGPDYDRAFRAVCAAAVDAKTARHRSG